MSRCRWFKQFNNVTTAHWQAIKLVKRSSPKDKIKLLRKTYQQASGSAKYAITSTENSVRREIAVMKECRHPNLAKLLEVIDDIREDKIYLSEPHICRLR